MSRARRSKSQVGAVIDGVSVLDKLVLAQATWEVGTSSWLKISRILGKHALLTHPKTFFTAQSCHAMYNHMMKESGFELSDSNSAAHAPIHLKLAEKYYTERVEELRTLISAEEEQFKSIVAEIDEIRAGQKDEEIKARISAHPTPEKEVVDLPNESAAITSDEVLAADVVDIVLKDDTPEVEVQSSTTETVQDTIQDEEPVREEEVPPTPDASIDAATPQPEPEPEPELEHVTASAATTPMALSSPNEENLDHLMQISDDENPPKIEITDPVTDPVVLEEPEAQETVGIIEPAVEVQEPVEPPATVDAVVEEPVIEIETPNAPEETVTLPDDSEMVTDQPQAQPEPVEVVDDAEAVAQPPSKPASRASDSASAPAPEEGSSRRRPSITTALPPPPAKKRGRPPKNVEPEVEAEQESTPAPTTNEPTPAMEDPQPEEGTPLSAPIRRREGKRKASYFGGVDSPRASKRPREESEPVDDDEQGAGPSALRRRTTGRTEEQVALKRFQTVINMVHNQISQHRNGNIFHNPIKVSEAPDYHDIVKRPIDLRTIKAKVKDGIIGNSLEYQRDIYLMFANAMMYNRPGSDVHAMAEDMMVESDSHINTFRQTEGFVKSR